MELRLLIASTCPPGKGFHVTGTLGLPDGAPVVSTMWRPGDSRDDAGA